MCFSDEQTPDRSYGLGFKFQFIALLDGCTRLPHTHVIASRWSHRRGNLPVQCCDYLSTKELRNAPKTNVTKDNSISYCIPGDCHGASPLAMTW